MLLNVGKNLYKAFNAKEAFGTWGLVPNASELRFVKQVAERKYTVLKVTRVNGGFDYTCGNRTSDEGHVGYGEVTHVRGGVCEWMGKLLAIAKEYCDGSGKSWMEWDE